MALTAGVHRYRHQALSGQVARVAAIGCEIVVDGLYRDGLPPGAALARD
jgi:hypothetical protein